MLVLPLLLFASTFPAGQQAQSTPKTSALCEVSFDKDLKRPSRVDNEAKACLDDVALTAQHQSDVTIVVVGNGVTGEKGGRYLAALRAVNVKDYLVTEKGLDSARVQVRTGSAHTKSVQNYVVPQGAEFDSEVPGTTPVNEHLVKPQRQYAASY